MPVENPVASGDPASAVQTTEVAKADGSSDRSGAVEHDRPAGTSATRMPVENPVVPADPASAGQTIEVAKADSGSDVSADQAGPKASPYDSTKIRGDGQPDRHDAQSVDAQVPTAETHNGVPGPSTPK
jgi:hypothetical protein